MELMFSFYRKKSFYTKMPIELIPYCKMTYIADMFLETGVTSKAFTIEFGILRCQYVFLVQEGYKIETKSTQRDKKIKKLLR